MSEAGSGPKVIEASPVLPVRDIAASIAFYEEKLGFLPRHEEAEFAIVRRDATDLLLTKLADEAWRTRDDFAQRPVACGAESFLSGTAACRIRVTGLDDLFAELLPKGGVPPNAKVCDQWWGDRDFSVSDPDGNLVTFYEAG